MIHGASQPTLDPPHDPTPAERLRALDLIESAALLALGRAAVDSAPATPCFALTRELADVLEGRGLLTVCGEDDASEAGAPVRAIYDPISWRYRLPDTTSAEFLESLRSQVRDLAREPTSNGLRCSLWRTLASAELEGYLAHLLRRHGFDARWASDVRDSGRRWDRGLSLAQARYVVWASVREGAAVWLRSGGDEDEVREALASEVRRRSAWIETRPDWGASFVPAPGGRQSILLSIFLDDVAPIGTRYWLVAPSEAALVEQQR